MCFGQEDSVIIVLVVDNALVVHRLWRLDIGSHPDGQTVGAETYSKTLDKIELPIEIDDNVPGD